MSTIATFQELIFSGDDNFAVLVFGAELRGTRPGGYGRVKLRLVGLVALWFGAALVVVAGHLLVGLALVVVGRGAGHHLRLGLALVYAQFLFELRFRIVRQWRRRRRIRLDVARLGFAEHHLQAHQTGYGDGQQTGHYRFAGQHEQRAQRQREQRAGHHSHPGGQHGPQIFVLFTST